MASFFPDYSFEDWVDAYAVLGGVPAYAEEFDPAVPLFENVRNNIFRETGIFRSDPELLIGEQVRDAKTYHAILEAIANGARQPAEIATLADIGPRVDISPYLVRLSEMDYLRSELPVSVPPEKHPQSRRTHYLITDAYLRFFFRFIRPSLPQLAQGLYDIVESRLKSHFKAFVGVTAFEEICREDVRIRSRQGRLPFQVENVGSHWSGGEGGERSQVDVAAINWKERCILLGEVKWTDAPLEANVVADLVGVKTENTLAVLNGTKKGGPKGEPWKVSYALFSRSGFTRPAAELARQSGAVMVEVKELREDFGV
jgi:AAA+ ATPase superfamily predicted ATPase